MLNAGTVEAKPGIVANSTTITLGLFWNRLHRTYYPSSGKRSPVHYHRGGLHVEVSSGMSCPRGDFSEYGVFLPARSVGQIWMAKSHIP